MTTQDLVKSSLDLRERRIHKVAALRKTAADGDATAAPAAAPAADTAAPAAPSSTFEFLSKVPPEAWGAVLGLGAGAGIGGAINGKKGALIGGGIGAAAGAGAGYGYRNKEAIAEAGGKLAGQAQDLGNSALATGKGLVDSGTAAVKEAAGNLVDATGTFVAGGLAKAKAMHGDVGTFIRTELPGASAEVIAKVTSAWNSGMDSAKVNVAK